MSTIGIHEVSKSFGPQRLLNAFSLSLAPGTVNALVGPSGSGKSTLLRLVAGLERPDAGEITIGGRVVSGSAVLVPPWERGIGMMFQDLALWPHMRVRRQLAFVLPHMPRRERNARIDALLALAELSDKANRYPSQLSGGEQQRVAFIRTVAPQSRVLLLDEPFSNLDGRLRAKFAEHLQDMKRNGVTMLVATHHEPDIHGLADAVVCLHPPAPKA